MLEEFESEVEMRMDENKMNIYRKRIMETEKANNNAIFNAL